MRIFFWLLMAGKLALAEPPVQPSWRIDLAALDDYKSSQQFTLAHAQRLIFIDELHLVALFASLGPVGPVASLFSIETQTASIRASRFLGSSVGPFMPGHGIEIVPLIPGRFLLLTGRLLRKGNAELNWEISRQIGSQETLRGDRGSVLASASGLTVVLRGVGPAVFISPKTLADIGAVPAFFPIRGFLTDESVVYSDLLQGGGDVHPPVPFLQWFNEPDRRRIGDKFGIVESLFGQNLIAVGIRDQFQIMDLAEHLLHQERGGPWDNFDQFSGAASRNRVAYVLRGRRSMGSTAQIRLTVFDVDQQKAVFDLELPESPSLCLALSPNGSRLILMRGSILEMFIVP